MEQTDTVYGVYLSSKGGPVWVEGCEIGMVYYSDNEEIGWEFLSVTISRLETRRTTFNRQAKARSLADYIGGTVQEFRAKVILEAV